MTRSHQLAATLRALGLSGMLDTLESRLCQAGAGELGHLEFLQALCEDEIARREAAALVRRVRAARFEATVTLEEFDFGFNPKIPTGLIRDLASLRFLEAGESVILHGPVGVGKTMVAQALGHQACRRGHSVAFTKTSRLLADLAGGHADRSWPARLHRWARPGAAHLRRLRDPGVHRRAGRRPLRARHRARRAQPGADREPRRRRLVPAVPEPGRRRVDPRP